MNIYLVSNGYVIIKINTLNSINQYIAISDSNLVFNNNNKIQLISYNGINIYNNIICIIMVV